MVLERKLGIIGFEILNFGKDFIDFKRVGLKKIQMHIDSLKNVFYGLWLYFKQLSIEVINRKKLCFRYYYSQQCLVDLNFNIKSLITKTEKLILKDCDFDEKYIDKSDI